MLTLDEARARLLAGVDPIGSERVPLARAAGRVLAEPVIAGGPLPPFDYSAMDGYALRVADLAGDAPYRLPVVGESRTGHMPPKLQSGTACRILTGAEVPEGADAVVMQEDTTRDGEHITLGSRPKSGAHIRVAGEDIRPGASALAPGTRIHPGHLALAASLDCVELSVARRPAVAIVCTGDELRAPGTTSRAGRASIAESNGVALAALVEQVGGRARLMPFVADDLDATVRALEEATASSDLVVTVGGVSVGDHDVVRPALERIGVVLDFYKVAIKPGKPLVFGRRGAARVLGLPGNPASAIVTFALFAAPLLRAMQGDAAPIAMTLPAILTGPVRHKPGRLELVRGVVENDRGGLVAKPLANQASGAATSTAWGNAMIVVPLDADDLPAGHAVQVIRFADV